MLIKDRKKQQDCRGAMTTDRKIGHAAAVTDPCGGPRAARWYWLVPVAVLLFVFHHFLDQDIPEGWDTLQHLRNALGLFFVAGNMPAYLTELQHQLAFTDPPFTYAVTAVLFRFSPTVWAFFGTTLLLDALFILFFYAACSALVKNKTVALLGVLVILATPQWRVVATSYNLEIALLVGLAGWMWLLLARPYERNIFRAAACGLAAGLLLLTKAVVLVHLAPAAIIVAALFLYRHRHQQARLLYPVVFAAPVLLIALAWYAALLTKIPGELQQDIHILAVQQLAPWWYYLTLLPAAYGAAPFWLAVLPCALFVDRRKLPAAAWIPLGAAISGLTFFTLMGTKREWYALGVHLLLVMAALAVIEHTRPRLRRAVVPLAAALYAALALLPWLPHTQAMAKYLSLGSARPAKLVSGAVSPNEEKIAAVVLERVQPFSLAGHLILDLSAKHKDWHIEQLVLLRRPYLTLLPDLNPAADLIPEMIPQARYLYVVEEDTPDSSPLAALHRGGESALDLHHAFAVQKTLARYPDRFRRIDRRPLAHGLTLAVYRNCMPLNPWELTVSLDEFTRWAAIQSPGLRAAFMRRTRRLANRGCCDEALARDRAVLAFDPDNIEARLGALACWPLLFSPEEEKRAIAEYLQAGPLQPPITLKMVERLSQLAERENERKSFSAALQTVLIRLSPSDPDRESVLMHLLAALLREGRNEQAWRLIELELESDKPPGEMHLLNMLNVLESFDAQSLIILLRGKLAANPATPVEWTNLVNTFCLETYSAEDEPDEAAFVAALSDPATRRKATDTLIKFSARWRRRGDTDRALRLIEANLPRIGDCRPCREDVRLELARIYIEAGRTEEAKKILWRLRLFAKDRDLALLAKNLLSSLP